MVVFKPGQLIRVQDPRKNYTFRTWILNVDPTSQTTSIDNVVKNVSSDDNLIGVVVFSHDSGSAYITTGGVCGWIYTQDWVKLNTRK